MENENKAMSPEDVEKQIRREMGIVRRKRMTREQMEMERRKYDNMYHACVLDGGLTVGPYIWREVYRRLLEECAWE